MGKKLLAVISSDCRVKDFLVNTLKNVIGSDINIIGYSLDDGINGPKSADLVLTSGKFTVPQAELIFPGCTIIPSKRMLTGYNLEQVMMLPKRKKVLVVNHPQSVSEETIENLKAWGITHLDYIPFKKGVKIDPDEIDTAISPGMLHLCPAGIKNKIDLGARTITMQTFMEVLLRLDLSIKYIDVFENNYNRLLLSAAKKIQRALNQSENLGRNLTVILNEIEEGILSVNEQQQFIFANPAMYTIFGRQPPLMANKNIQEIMGSLETKAHTSEADPDSDSAKSSDLLYSLQNRKLVCTKNVVSMGSEKSFIYTFREVSQIQKMEQKVRINLHEKGYVAKHTFDDIWGENQKIQAAKKKAGVFAATEETILITGESGTGKELFAQAIHRSSSRREGPFVAMNFAAIPEDLVESELFGYQEGAFTGARKGGKPGIFEVAHGGTLFLDEIGDAPLNIQARLLRVLEEREVMRLGDAKIIPVDVRVVAATNQNLLDCVNKKLFRLDLFYRLSVLMLEIPALREFREEIPHFLKRMLFEKYRIEKGIKPEVIEFLLKYDWPGNMRELRNVADYAYYSSLDEECIGIENIPNHLKRLFPADSPEERNSILKDLLPKLKCGGDIDEIVAILQIFFPSNAIGRNKLVEILAERGVAFTENKAKKYFRMLGDLGLLATGRTKQGSSLTGLGRDVYLLLSTSGPNPCKSKTAGEEKEHGEGA